MGVDGNLRDSTVSQSVGALYFQRRRSRLQPVHRVRTAKSKKI